MFDQASASSFQRKHRASFETSPFGYWIRPDGHVFPMQKLQSHGEWIAGEGIDADPKAPGSDAVKGAISLGWIAVSISPIGSSCGVRAHQGVVPKAAVDGLMSALRLSGFYHTEVVWNGTEVTGRVLCLRLRGTG